MRPFVLLFLLSNVTVATAVTGCLSGRDKDHRTQKNCTAAGFTDVPTGIEPRTQVLLFTNNLFNSLTWASYQIFPKIYGIDLTGNQVTALSNSSPPVLPTLKVLKLGSNRLTSLPEHSFSACPGLIELHLPGNTISSLSDLTFSGLNKLEILDLSYNNIRVLPNLMLHPLSVIETLMIQNNKILVMPSDWFSQKEEVPYLYLSDNPWTCSCSLDYLRRYLGDYDYNVYILYGDGPYVTSNPESVVCDSPARLKGTPVVNLEEADLCGAQAYSATQHPDEPTPTPAASWARATMSWYELVTQLVHWIHGSDSEVRGDGAITPTTPTPTRETSSGAPR